MSILKSREQNPSQNTNCGNVTGSYNNTWNNCDISVTDERRHILEWLSPLAPRLRHRDVRRSQMEGIGDWLLRTEEFINWNTAGDGVASPVLFCYGDPGVGKTHLSSSVVETLCQQNIGKPVAVACLYCDFNARDEQSTAHMLGAILKQVVNGWEHIPHEIETAFERSKKNLGGRELGLAEILKILISTLRTLERTYICIDALDEFSEQYRPELFESLALITRESRGARLFVTGRQHIREEVEIYFTKRAEIQIIPSKEDIKKYLTLRLRKDTRPRIMNDSLREEILTTIPEKISEIFLLVSLSMNEILAQSTIRGRREKLGQMTSGKGTDGVYAATLKRIMEQDGDQGKLAMEALMWVSRSERQLGAEELCHALGIKDDSTEMDPENVPAIETLLSCCLGLVTVDEKGSRVRLVHLTLQEYLGGRPDISGSAHSKMADVCLTYLNFRSIKDLPPNLWELPEITPFLDYASCYWGVHARKELTERTKTIALQLMDQYDHHVAATMLLRSGSLWGGYSDAPTCGGFTGLHAIAYFGVAEIARCMIKSGGWEVNKKDSEGFTPLMWAARNNNREVCEILLELGGGDPNIGGYGGLTPLLLASAAGHEGVVKLLLERGRIDPNSSCENGKTPLLKAASGGHEGIVKLLLGREEVNPDSRDKSGKTPLLKAASGGHEGIVKLLLGREEVNPDSRDKSGKTPLRKAASGGHEGIVKLLLERKEVNPGSDDELGQTPLWGAVRNGREGIVKLLLEREEVNPDSSDKFGQTPLWGAAICQHEGIVKLLLERGEVNPDSPDMDGETPLWWAASNGHVGIVKLLLEREEVNPDSRDKSGKTPLRKAASSGREGTVKLLLERKEVNPDSRDKSGKTPLLKAASSGHQGVVELLLERNEVNPDSRDENGKTPLMKAASGGHEGIVKLLLERAEVNPDSPGQDGRTLLPAAFSLSEGIIKLLLEHQEQCSQLSRVPSQAP